MSLLLFFRPHRYGGDTHDGFVVWGYKKKRKRKKKQEQTTEQSLLAELEDASNFKETIKEELRELDDPKKYLIIKNVLDELNLEYQNALKEELKTIHNEIVQELSRVNINNFYLPRINVLESTFVETERQLDSDDLSLILLLMALDEKIFH